MDAYTNRYKFDGDALDANGTNNGSATNATYMAYPKIEGSKSVALALGYVTLATTYSLKTVTQWTVCAWVWVTGASTEYVWYSNSAISPGDFYGYRFAITGKNKLLVEINKGSGPPLYSGTANKSFRIGQWNHVAVADNNGTLLGFHNGEQVISTSYTRSAVAGGNSNTIGSYRWNNGFSYNWEGYIDDVRYYGTDALTGDEVKTVYNSYFPGNRFFSGTNV